MCVCADTDNKLFSCKALDVFCSMWNGEFYAAGWIFNFHLHILPAYFTGAPALTAVQAAETQRRHCLPKSVKYKDFAMSWTPSRNWNGKPAYPSSLNIRCFWNITFRVYIGILWQIHSSLNVTAQVGKVLTCYMQSFIGWAIGWQFLMQLLVSSHLGYCSFGGHCPGRMRRALKRFTRNLSQL